MHRRTGTDDRGADGRHRSRAACASTPAGRSASTRLLEFELPERARINGRARVLREQAYRVYALRFEKLGDEARAEIAELTQPRDRAGEKS